MTNDLKLKLTLSVDKKEGETNLQAFNRAFDQAMTGIGKSADDIDAFRKLSKDLTEGKAQVEDLDEEAQQLFDTFKKGAEQAADQDILDINYLDEAQQEIDETIEAYKELANAADKWQEQLKDSDDIKALEGLNKDLDEGKVKLGQLNEKTLKLLTTFRKQAQLVDDRDLLGIRQHSEIQKEIEETRAAYKRLKNSGELTHKELAQAAIKTEDRIRDLKSQTNGWTESLENAKGSIAALAGSAAGLAVVSGKAIEFESAMADVKKVVDGTDEDFERLTGRIKEMTEELPITASGLAQIAAAGGQLGVPIEKLDQFIELAAKMSVSFDLSVEQAGQAVAKLSNIFNIPIENVEALGDAINTLGNTTAAKEAEILNVLTRIGGTASQFKLTAEQSAALAATMIEMGASSEVAGTGINALLTKLQTANVQGPKFQSALEGMGVSADQLAENIRNNPQQALTEFLETLSQLDDAARAETLTQLFGQEYQDDIARLLNGLDKYDASLKRVTDTGNTAGAMQREFNARMETTEAQILLMQNGLNSVAINLGTIFLPAIRAGAVALGDAADALADFVEANPALATLITTLGTAALSAGALRLAFLSMRYVGVKSFGDINKEVALARGSIKDMEGQVGKLGKAIRVIGGGIAAWSIGRDIGKYLHDEFEIARLAGVRLAQSFTWLMETADALWKVLQNPLDAEQIWADYQAKLDQVNKTYQQMYDEVDAGEDVIRRNAAAAKETGEALEKAGIKGVDAAQKIRDEFKKLDLTTPKGVVELTKELDKAAGKTSVLSEELKKWIDEANATDLTGFQTSLKTAFDEGRLSAEQLAEYNDKILQKSFEALGLVAESALGDISPAAQEAIDQLDLIKQTLSDLSVTGQQRMTALEQAIRGALNQADSIAAVDQLSRRIEELGEAGDLTYEQLKRLNGELKEQIESINQLTPGIQSAEEAMKQLGVTSQAELKKTAASSKEAYDYLVKSKAPIEDQRKAFISYARTAIDANKGVVSSELKVQAAVLGVKKEFEELGDSSTKALSESTEKAKELSGAVDEVTESVEAAAVANNKLGDSLSSVSKRSEELAGGMAKYYNELRDSLGELAGDEYVNKFDQVMTRNARATEESTEGLDDLAKAAANARQEIADAHKQMAQPDFTGFNRQLARASITYNSLIIDANNARDANGEVSGSLDKVAESASRVRTGWPRLNPKTLRPIVPEIEKVADGAIEVEKAADSAKQALVDMGDQSLSAFERAEDQIDGLLDRQDLVDQRRKERERDELESKKLEASRAGDGAAVKEFEYALRLLDIRDELNKKADEYTNKIAIDREKIRELRKSGSKSDQNKIYKLEERIEGYKRSLESAQGTAKSRLKEVQDKQYYHRQKLQDDNYRDSLRRGGNNSQSSTQNSSNTITINLRKPNGNETSFRMADQESADNLVKTLRDISERS